MEAITPATDVLNIMLVITAVVLGLRFVENYVECHVFLLLSIVFLGLDILFGKYFFDCGITGTTGFLEMLRILDQCLPLKPLLLYKGTIMLFFASTAGYIKVTVASGLSGTDKPEKRNPN